MKKLLCHTVAILLTTLSSFAQLTNMNPNVGALGQLLTTTITGTGIFIQTGSPSGNLHEIMLQQGAHTIWLFDIWNSFPNVNITSDSTVVADVNIPFNVPPGLYDLNVTVGDINFPWMTTSYFLPGAFTVGPPDGLIEGNVFHDLNENGFKDIGEPGLFVKKLHLLPGNYDGFTDGNGDYSFPVMNGNHTVNYVNVTEYMFVTTVNDTLPVTINNNTSSGNDFGLKNALESMSPDSGIQGGATLHTFVADEPIFATGTYPFGNVLGVQVISNTYIVVPDENITVIDPYTIQAIIPVPLNAITEDSIDIYVSVSGVYAGAHYLRKKYRIVPPDGYVQGQLYYDSNNNGIKDIGEAPIPNYRVKLLPSNMIANTDVNGNYSIGAINGNYTVTVPPWSSYYLFDTSLDTIPVTINNGNSTGNDFGLKSALVSVTPNIAYAGLTQTHQIVADQPIFIPGGGPSGNIAQVLVSSTPYVDLNVNTSVTIIDSFTVQVIITLPLNITVANDIDMSIRIDSGHVGWHGLFQQLDIGPPPCYISGRFFYDLDQDKVNDPGEPGINGGKVKIIPDNNIAFSDLNGNFLMGSIGGVQTLTYENNLPGYVLFTDSSSYTFNASGNVTGKDFGFLLTNPDYDISVTDPYTFPRCNTNQPTSFKVSNVSNVTFDALAWLHHSPNMSYVSSTIPPSGISNDTIYWDLTNIPPFGFVNIGATFTLPGAGQIINLNLGASSLDAVGVVQLSDAASKTYTITCAWDPNDKTVSPPGIFTQNFTLMSDTLEYLVRFQNTGNDTAFNVVVLDTLDSNLDYNTFEILGSSHSVQTELQSNGAVRFAFNNILLPDSNINEPESHGYVRYRIMANQGLMDSTEIINTAHIFFDFNPDVITNSTLNTLVFVLPTGVGELLSNDEKVIFYPNPLSHSANLLFDNPSAEMHTLSLTAITGNKIAAEQTTTGNSFVIEKGKLPKGIYFYNLTNTVTNKMHSGKFIVD